MFLSEEFSISEKDIHQILKLNYCEKLQKWWSEDVDGDCISSNFFEETQKIQ